MTALPEHMPAPECRVYAVIPVFNRIEETLGCIDCLKRQTHPAVTIIVADGGSTDGTPAILREKHPDVIVVTANRTLWWGGATRHGIDRALADGAGENDFIFMVNNDTRFDAGILEQLIETSRRYDAAVGCVVVNTDDPEEVIDGGINLDWKNYAFSTVKTIPADTDVKLDSDMLPGRGTLVPVRAIHKAGNVDDRNFPHYIADYEFTHRLKRKAGLTLAVDYRARVRTRVETGKEDKEPIFRGYWKRMFSRRSKSNKMDHLRFIRKHAPEAYRTRLVVHFLTARLMSVIRKIYRAARRIFRLILAPFPGLRYLVRVLCTPYLVNEIVCRRYDLSVSELCERGILERAGYIGYYRIVPGLGELRRQAPEAMPLYWWAMRPDVKLREYKAIHKTWPFAARFEYLFRVFFKPYLVSEAACNHYALSSEELCDLGVLERAGYPGYYRFITGPVQTRRKAPAAVALYWWAMRPDVKLREYRKVHARNNRKDYEIS